MHALHTAVAVALVPLILSACGPDTTAGGFFEGPPPFMPAYPGGDKTGEVFYAEPGCSGPGYIVGYGGQFDYASVRAGFGCVDESGVGYGFLVQP